MPKQGNVKNSQSATPIFLIAKEMVIIPQNYGKVKENNKTK